MHLFHHYKEIESDILDSCLLINVYILCLIKHPHLQKENMNEYTYRFTGLPGRVCLQLSKPISHAFPFWFIIVQTIWQQKVWQFGLTPLKIEVIFILLNSRQHLIFSVITFIYLYFNFTLCIKYFYPILVYPRKISIDSQTHFSTLTLRTIIYPPNFK